MGSIKLGSTSINKMYLGSTEVKKVYLGSTLIWENTPAVTYTYMWQPIFKNNSTTTNPAFIGMDGTVTLRDSNNNVLTTATVTIPSMGNSQSANIGFTSSTIYSSVTAEFAYGSYVFSTTTVGYAAPSAGVRYGSPINVGFSFD